MKIKKVTIKKIDDFGPRILKVKTKKQNFEAPTRAINSTEANYKKKVAGSLDSLSSYYYENPIFEIVKNYKKEKLKDMYTKNGPLNNEKKAIRSSLNCYEDKICLFYPRFDKGTILTDKDIKSLIDLQVLTGFDIITIPDLHISASVREFEKNIVNGRKRIETMTASKFEAIPYVDMGSEPKLFKAKIDTVLDNGFCIIGITNRSIASNYANYDYLEENKDKEIWIHASNVRRYLSYRRPVSQMHMLQIYGIDTCALESRKGGPGIKHTPPDRVRRFDAKTLGMITKDEHYSRYGSELNCNCPICNGKNLESFYDEYSLNTKGMLDTDYLRTHSNIHEVFASYEEFKRGQDAIKNNDFKVYINNKEHIKGVEIIKTRSSQTHLFQI